MIVIGLTGGIGMGKSTTAHILRRWGFPIFNADAAVHEILKNNEKAIAALTRLFPETLKRGAIDRKLLGQAVFAQPDKLQRLERILHPLVRQAEQSFLQKERRAKARAAILEIPLLFETGGEKRCTLTLCVTAPRAIQKARALSRPDMTEEKLRILLARQMPDAEKRSKADYVLPTGKSVETTEKHLRKLFEKLSLLP